MNNGKNREGEEEISMREYASGSQVIDPGHGAMRHRKQGEGSRSCKGNLAVSNR